MSASRHPILCARCDEVIGVYEPVIAVHDDEVKKTSLAADRELAARPGKLYHAACWTEVNRSF
jgi:hypothetical protein